MSYQTKLEQLEQKKAAFQKSSPARDRITALFDQGTFVELDAFTGCEDGVGVITGYGSVEGDVVYAFSQDVTTLGGAVSRAHAAKIAKIYDLAVKNGAPLVAIYDSNGAKLSEGPEILASYGKILADAANLSGVVPQIAVVAGSCVGISAMMACSADVVVMAEDASLYFADAEGDDSAAAAMEAGVVDILCENAAAAVAKARELVSMLPLNNLSVSPVCEGTASGTAVDPNMDSIDLIKAVCDADTVVELKAGYGDAACTALASLGGGTVGVVYANGQAGRKSNSKIADFVRFCDCFNLPVITFVNVDGFCTCGGVKTESAKVSAKLARAYADATTAKITVYTGSAIGGAAVAFGCADLRIAWPTAVISALAPLTAVEFFWHDKLKGADDAAKRREELAAEYADTEASPYEAAKASMVEEIMDPANTRNVLISALEMLASKRVSRLPKKHTN